MPDKYRFADWRGGNDEIRKEHGIEIPSPLVLAELLDSSRDFDQYTFEEAQVFATTNHSVSHIFNSIATPIILCGESS
jgi:hypothetical protein